MGFSKHNHAHGTITSFTPDDTDDEFYISTDATIGAIMERAAEKWPDLPPDEIKIAAEYIHTDCIGYDRYDSGDYTNYLRIYR